MRDVQPTTTWPSWVLLLLLLHDNGTTLCRPLKSNEQVSNTIRWRNPSMEVMNKLMGWFFFPRVKTRCQITFPRFLGNDVEGASSLPR